MPTGTVRINQKSHNILRKIASTEGKPMQAILEAAIEEYRRQRFLHEANAAYAALRNDPKEWKEELAERKEWDSTLIDGQEDD
ncbi:MAG: toxin-antitoxin system protein [Deltaproteobacteria bacterium]|nr:toxin-antitoxin system protein [Deltaproteobacteria bacterium]